MLTNLNGTAKRQRKHAKRNIILDGQSASVLQKSLTPMWEISLAADTR